MKTLGEKCINKIIIHMHKETIYINGIDPKKQCFLGKNHTIINSLLDIMIIMMVLYHYT